MICLSLLSAQGSFAGALKCHNPSLEVARCNLVEAGFEGEPAAHFPIPVEGLACAQDASQDKVDLITRTGDLPELAFTFERSPDGYRLINSDAGPTVMSFDKGNGLLKVVEFSEGKKLSLIYSCIFW